MYKLRYTVGFGLVEMTIATNEKPTTCRNLFESTGPAAVQKQTAVTYTWRSTSHCCLPLYSVEYWYGSPAWGSPYPGKFCSSGRGKERDWWCKNSKDPLSFLYLNLHITLAYLWPLFVYTYFKHHDQNNLIPAWKLYCRSTCMLIFTKYMPFLWRNG